MTTYRKIIVDNDDYVVDRLGFADTNIHPLGYSPVDRVLDQYDLFWKTTGVPPDQVFVDPSFSYPMPVYADDGMPGWKRSELKPEGLWHPLLWLPAELAAFSDEEATIAEISADQMNWQWDAEDGSAPMTLGMLGRSVLGDEPPARHYANLLRTLRLIMAVLNAGLYDPEQGWVDVLAMIDVDSDDHARLQRWIDGEADDALDGFKLSIDNHPDWDDVTDETWPQIELTAGMHQAAAIGVNAALFATLLDEAENNLVEGNAEDVYACILAVCDQLPTACLYVDPEYVTITGSIDTYIESKIEQLDRLRDDARGMIGNVALDIRSAIVDPLLTQYGPSANLYHPDDEEN